MAVKNVLITGYSGNVGEPLVKGLKDVFDLRGISRHPKEYEGIKVYKADIADIETLYEPFDGVDVIVHLAADPNMFGQWDSVLKNNIEGTYNIFEAARKTGVKRVIFASSNHVTGLYTKKRIRMNTDMPVAPDGLYGVSKVFGEALGKYYAEYFGLSVFSLRIGWTTKEDDPRVVLNRDGDMQEELFRMWLSHRDLVDMVKKCCLAPMDIKHHIFYCMSENTGSLWDHTDAKTLVGYSPKDDSSTFDIEQKQWFQQD